MWWMEHTERASERSERPCIRMDADDYVMGVLRMEKPNWEMEERL